MKLGLLYSKAMFVEYLVILVLLYSKAMFVEHLSLVVQQGNAAQQVAAE